MTSLQQRIFKTLLLSFLTLSLFVTSNAVFAETVQASTSATSKANKVVTTGNKHLGKPYVFGARSGITSAFDCSSLVQYLYKQVGVKLPRTSKDQAKAGKYVSKSNLKKGDLVFFSVSKPGQVNHVAIYVGNGKILHTYKKGVGVAYSNLSEKTWKNRYITARRVL